VTLLDQSNLATTDEEEGEEGECEKERDEPDNCESLLHIPVASATATTAAAPATSKRDDLTCHENLLLSPPSDEFTVVRIQEEGKQFLTLNLPAFQVQTMLQAETAGPSSAPPPQPPVPTARKPQSLNANNASMEMLLDELKKVDEQCKTSITEINNDAQARILAAEARHVALKKTLTEQLHIGIIMAAKTVGLLQ